MGYQSILDFYYPGTRSFTQTNTPLHVLLSADNDDELRVVATGQMTASDARNTDTPIGFPGATVSHWRVLRQPDGFYLQGLVNGSWRAWSQSPSPGFLSLRAPGTTVRVVLPGGVQKEYRGSIRAVPDGTAPDLRSVNVVGMEDYLRAVVPAESPSSWPSDALRAQAVAARTYASYDRATSGGDQWHTCDTTQCQVYPGVRTFDANGRVTATHEASSTNAAITASANQVRHYGAGLAFTQFSASNGGWTAPGNLPYQVAKRDPWDPVGNPSHAWSTRLAVSRIADAFPQIGVPGSIEVRSRNGHGEWGGRVDEVVLRGSRSSVTTSGSAFRSRFGLRSDWWRITGSTALDSDTTTDGRVDMTALMNDGTLRTYESDGAGGFAGSWQIGHGWSSTRLLTRANDLTGDGRADLLAVDSAGVMRRYPADGSGRLLPAIRMGSGWDAMRLLAAPGDLDGNGTADLLAVDTSGVMWRYDGRGNGAFAVRQRVGSGWAGFNAIYGGGDWTGDGRADFLAVDSAGGLWLYRNLGGHRFSPTQIGNGWSTMRVMSVLRDWDGDGGPDILAAGPSGVLNLYRWTGTRFVTRSGVGSGWGIVRDLA
ncbi:SpoIID/LytB domain-containing protein [Cellulosimicrobium sp. NPDC057127]|uniref:SpoIID/LytB domain-containing protein n=1 Tax=Cellulosimicrobium sp. NPDC057127 TaxID=3346026 RepID=UPI003639FA44